MKTMPDICHLWYATESSKAVKSTPERTPIHDQNCLATKQHTGVFGVLGAVDFTVAEGASSTPLLEGAPEGVSPGKRDDLLVIEAHLLREHVPYVIN